MIYRLIIILILFSSCKEPIKNTDKLHVLTTTNILADLVFEIGGEEIELQNLMGPGVDPHLYKASEGDVLKIYNADIIFYSGLHLEGKLTDVFRKLQHKRKMISLGDLLPKENLITSSNFGGNYDPHVWFDVHYIKLFCDFITEELSKADPKNSELFKNNNKRYQSRLDILQNELNNLVQELPKEKRILVTAHDAFGYFGQAFDFTVVGLQGISTATEAGVRDVRVLTNYIIDNDVKAIFIENSVPRRMIEALLAAVKSRGKQISIGGELYSDTLGTAGTPEGTYIGMYKHNVTSIINALK